MTSEFKSSELGTTSPLPITTTIPPSSSDIGTFKDVTVLTLGFFYFPWLAMIVLCALLFWDNTIVDYYENNSDISTIDCSFDISQCREYMYNPLSGQMIMGILFYYVTLHHIL